MTEKLNGDIVESNLTNEQKVDLQKRRWKNRRRMAWVAMANLTVIVLLYFFAPIPETRLKIIAEPLAMVTFGFVGIVGAYMGFSSFEKTKMGR